MFSENTDKTVKSGPDFLYQTVKAFLASTGMNSLSGIVPIWDEYLQGHIYIRWFGNNSIFKSLEAFVHQGIQTSLQDFLMIQHEEKHI